MPQPSAAVTDVLMGGLLQGKQVGNDTLVLAENGLAAEVSGGCFSLLR